jgi:hypothetical protein
MTAVSTSRRAPARMIYKPETHKRVHELKLPIKGQGTVSFAIESPAKAFSLAFSTDLLGAPTLRLDVSALGAALTLVSLDGTVALPMKGSGDALDMEPACLYWFSIDCLNRALICGKGEQRLGCATARYDFERPPHGEPDPWSWLREIRHVRVEADLRANGDGERYVTLGRDPVVGEPPLYVVSHDQYGMDDIGAGVVTVPANLSQRCQQLYGAVGGAMFELDTPDFRHFSAAIAASIRNPGGWCYQTLEKKRKEDPFGDPNALYLRITAGRSHGESPGIPYVMEIWPSGCHSPIHNHGGADAVIRVLAGQIKVSLYPMLSKYHETPFAEARFDKGDVTWISPALNQFHKLENDHPDPCITIQCFWYAETNYVHWPYFDFLDAQNDIGHFDPDSDCDYDKFKAIMKAEWDNPPAADSGLIEVTPVIPAS